MTTTSHPPRHMPDRSVHAIEVTLVPQATSTLGLKLMSLLHARGVEIHSFSFTRGENRVSMASIRVVSSTARVSTLAAKLGQIVGVLDVTFRISNRPSPDMTG